MFKINNLLSCIIFYNVYIIIIYQAWLSNRPITSGLKSQLPEKEERKSTKQGIKPN